MRSATARSGSLRRGRPMICALQTGPAQTHWLRAHAAGRQHILWMIWSFALAYVIFRFLQKFSLQETIFLAWLPAFVMMWIVIYKLQVLPLRLLIFAVPLSLLEVLVAALIIRTLAKE